MGKTLLFEIGTEELPASFVLPALDQLEQLVREGLSEARIDFESIQVYGTPRRLVLMAKGVAEKQREATFEVRGPTKQVAFDAEGKPTKAALGFAQSQGVPVESLEVRQTDRGDFVFAKKHDPGRPSLEVLAEFLPKATSQLSFPKMMRWGKLQFKFGRPIRWVLALLGEDVIPFELAGLKSSRTTLGHRFLHPQPIELKSADEYLSEMERAFVIVDHERRKQKVYEIVRQEAKRLGGQEVVTQELLNEVNFLIECPTPVLGRFDESYLSLPRDVLIAVMMHHQRYFPIEQGRNLLPYFVAICNGQRQDIETIRKGYEKVLSARLADAKFFFDEDTKHPLEAYVPKLKGLLFQQGLGSMLDKTERIVKLVEILCEKLKVPEGERQAALQAAKLCKADLVTQMVTEFTELQGVMGREYALRSGESPEVADAIFEHYLPRFAEDSVPNSLAGALIGLADRTDTLCACFDRNLIPTGSHDPLGLRRAAQGIVSVLDWLFQYRLSLSDLLDGALSLLEAAGLLKKEPKQTKAQVMEFLKQRIEALLEDEGIPHDIRQAVLSAGFDDVPDTVVRAKVLKGLRAHEDNFVPTVIAFTRVTNILTKRTDAPFNPMLLQEEPERRLYEEFQKVVGQLPLPLRGKGAKAYEEAFRKLARLKPAIDAFFGTAPGTGVLVMHPDERLRNNRLALVQEIESVLRQIADFSRIVV